MWEKALESFLEEWRDKDDVLAAVLTGSHAAGNATPRSDIDVILVLSDGVTHRERGNCVREGHLIEYFANPAGQILQYMREELAQGVRADACMLASGTVLFDKTGIVEQLKARARQDLAQPLQPMEPADLEMTKYHLWDGFDEVQQSRQEGTGAFDFACSVYLQQLAANYFRFLRVPQPAVYKLVRYCRDQAYRDRLPIPGLPDSVFMEKFLECLDQQDPRQKFRQVDALRAYVVERLGGFQIDGWALRTPRTDKAERQTETPIGDGPEEVLRAIQQGMKRTHRASGRAVILRDGHLLLMRYKGGEYYNFPGGAVEAGETLAECAKREVLEETGLTVDVGEALFTLEVETQRCGISGNPHLSIFFACTVDESQPVLEPSHPDRSLDDPTWLADAYWAPLDSLRQLNFLPYIPDSILAYANSGVFEPSFLSGQFEKVKER